MTQAPILKKIWNTLACWRWCVEVRPADAVTCILSFWYRVDDERDFSLSDGFDRVGGSHGVTLVVN